MTIKPLLKKYGATVTFFITQLDSLSNTEISLLKELQFSDEIGSHCPDSVTLSSHRDPYQFDVQLLEFILAEAKQGI